MHRFAILITVGMFTSTVGVSQTHAFDQRKAVVGGPILAQVIRVLDGDTVEVMAYPWPQQSVDVLVRLRGIDAPEIHSRCSLEREKALHAKRRLQAFLQSQPKVLLTDIGGGKYFGRVLANLGLPDGRDAASELILENLVRPYSGGKKELPAC